MVTIACLLIYIQYKFFVDGEWRHDEHQPYVSGNYGVVNTIFLARESDTIPPNLGSDTAGRSHMEVDGDPFPQVCPLVLCLYTQSFSTILCIYCSIQSCSTAFEMLSLPRSSFYFMRFTSSLNIIWIEKYIKVII